MNVIVERVKRELEKIFSSKIDMSDVVSGTPEQIKEHMLSRALAAYSLVMEGNITPDEAALCVTDGGGDYGIDALHIDPVSKRFIVVQSKIRNDGRSSLDIGDMAAFCNGIQRLIDNDYSQANRKILNKKNEIDEAIFGVGYKIEALIIYTSNTPLSQDVEYLIQKLQRDMNECTDFVSYKMILLKNVHDHMQSGAVGAPIDSCIQIENWGVLKEQEFPRGYYGLISAQELGKLWKDNKESLLSKNIRYFKGATEVNDGIKKNLKENPSKFVYFNNGLKIVADKVDRTMAHGDSRDVGLFSLKNLSVVNGAQTLGCVGEVYEENPDQLKDVKVFAHVISLENSDEGFGNDVTKLSNTQNRIEKKDFLSVADPYHENLRKEFALDGIYYSYRAGDLKEGLLKVCNVDDAVVALGAAIDDVDVSTKVKSNVGSIYDDLNGGTYKRIFNQSVGPHRVWNSVQFFKKYDEIRNSYAKQHEKLEKLVAVHGNCFILHLFFMHFKNDPLLANIDTQYLDFNANAIATMSTWFNTIVDEVVKIKNANYSDSYPANLFKNSTKCKAIKDKLVSTGVV